MPFIEKQDKTKLVGINVRIRPEVETELKTYAEFLESDVSYIVNEILANVFKKDKHFRAFKEKAKAQQWRRTVKP